MFNIEAESWRDDIHTDLTFTAHFRREKQEEYPEDKRNKEAAELLEKLLETVSEIDESMLLLFAEHFDSEKWSDILRHVGFHDWPTSASDLVFRLIEEQRG